MYHSMVNIADGIIEESNCLSFLQQIQSPSKLTWQISFFGPEGSQFLVLH
jgi:hypothetical protein